MNKPTLKLPAALERFVATQVGQGDYPSRQAAIVGAVANEKRRIEQREWLTRQLADGLASGTSGPLDIEAVLRRGRARLATRERRRAV